MTNPITSDSEEKTPEGAFSQTLRLNTTDYTAVRQVLLVLLTEYKEMDFPANPELLKLHIDAAVDKLVTEVEQEGSSTDDRANTKAHSELAQEAQSEAPSVYIREMLLDLAVLGTFNDDTTNYKLIDEVEAKINRLIVEARIDEISRYHGNRGQFEDNLARLKELQELLPGVSNNLSKGKYNCQH